MTDLKTELTKRFPLPDDLDSVEFLVKRTGLLDEIIMPELREKFQMENTE